MLNTLANKPETTLGIKEVIFFDSNYGDDLRTCTVVYGETNKPVNIHRLLRHLERRAPWLERIIIKGEEGLDPLEVGDSLASNLETLGFAVDLPITLVTYCLDFTFFDLLFNEGMIDGVIHQIPPEKRLKELTENQIKSINKMIAFLDMQLYKNKGEMNSELE